eukprot:GEMP01036300.1.p1 GENE.GEMP01036300.1~~GEMP01036300.1.p1  ORF type:complete len:339 (+),score=49.64 GEMP01036300.1:153-1169(+)
MVKLLVAHAANINIENEKGNTVLFMVEQWDSIDIAKALIDCGANIHHKNKVGFEPLLAVVFGRAEDVMKLLLDHRADVNQPSYSGQTPLMAAVFRGRKTMVKMLLANKANVNHQAKDGETALAVAIEKSRTDLVEILRDHGAIVYCKSRDNVLADTSEGESRDCKATSANKRRMKNEDGASSKDICVSENDFAKEEKKKERREGDSSCSQDKKNMENDDVSGWGTSTSKDMETLDDEKKDALAEKRKELGQEFKNLLHAFNITTDLALAKLDVLQKAIDEKTLSENNDEAEKNFQTSVLEREAAGQARETDEQKLKAAISAYWSLMPDSTAHIDIFEE